MVGGLLMSDYQTINPKVNIKSNRIIFEEGKRQGALEELKYALLLSKWLTDKDIESYLNKRIKELEE